MVTTSPIARRAALAAALAASLALAACGAQRQHNKIAKQGEELRYELAALYVDRGIDQAAVPLLRKILADNPKDVHARILYGKVMRDLGLHPQAEAELRAALTIEPDNAEAHAAMGILYDLQHKPKNALRHHMRAVQLVPSIAKYRNNLGFSLYLAGKTDAAVIQLEKALHMDPSMVVAYNNLGFAYGRAGEFERARRTFRTALSEASTLLNMALVYDEHGQPDTASALRAQAYDIDPDLRPDEENL